MLLLLATVFFTTPGLSAQSGPTIPEKANGRIVTILLGTGSTSGQKEKSDQRPPEQTPTGTSTQGPLTSQWSPGAIPYGAANLPISIFPAITGQPFRAEVNARKTKTKPDGKQVTYESHGIVARDSEGRVLQERLPSPRVVLSDGVTSTTLSARVTDPGAKLEFRWDDITRMVFKMRPLEHQIRTTPEPLDACEREEGKTRTYPDGTTQRIESLGERSIQGIPTRGCRVYALIPAQPNVQSRTIVDDSWSSTEMGMSLLLVHHDPSGEDETIQLNNLVPGEPDSALFQPPADYKQRDPEQEELQREQTQPSITHPELLAGVWETDSNGVGATDGFDLVLFTRMHDSSEHLSTIQLRMHHIENLQEKWGWFTVNEDKTASWDGKRLRLDFDPATADQASLHFDLAFDPAKKEWSGEFNRDGRRRQVILKRPGALSNPPASPLVGDWYLHSDRSRPIPRGAFYEDFCLHIVERVDGSFTAWTDRKFSNQAQYGTRLKVLKAIGNSIELQSDNAGGNTVTIGGSVAADGQSMEVKWSTNGTQDTRPPRILIKNSGEGFSRSLPNPQNGVAWRSPQ
jgi:hypothetical protein